MLLHAYSIKTKNTDTSFGENREQELSKCFTQVIHIVEPTLIMKYN